MLKSNIRSTLKYYFLKSYYFGFSFRDFSWHSFFLSARVFDKGEDVGFFLGGEDSALEISEVVVLFLGGEREDEGDWESFTKLGDLFGSEVSCFGFKAFLVAEGDSIAEFLELVVELELRDKGASEYRAHDETL